MKNHFKRQIDEYITYLSDCEYIESCKYFIAIASNYFEKASNNKNQIGITTTTFPEIFIRACGASPVYLLGGYEGNIEEVEDIFPQISDYTTKAVANLLLNKEMPFEKSLKGVIVPITNDSNRKIATYLESHGYKVIRMDNTAFVLNHTPEAYKKQQSAFLNTLIKMLRRPMTKRRLLESAGKITKSHQLFVKIDEAQIETKLKIFLKETYYLTNDMETWQKEVEKLLSRVPRIENKEKQLLLVGGAIQFPNHKVGLILEETGVQNYRSECSVPYPYDYSGLNEKLPLFLLCKQIYNIHYKNEYSSEALGSDKVSFDKNTRAVIFHLLKGQLLSAYYADKVEKNCIAQNIPFLCIETDCTKADREQIKIRIEAFTELLNVNRRSEACEKQMA